MRARVIAVVISAMILTALVMNSSPAFAVEEKTDYRLRDKIRNAIENLESKKGNARRDARKDLIEWGAPSVEPLLEVVKAWKENSPNLRVECVSILGEIGDQRAVEVILSVLNEDRLTMRYNAARALGQIGDKRAVPELIKMLDAPEWEVRFYALEALSNIGDAQASGPVAAMVSKDNLKKIRLTALKALDNINAKSEYKAVMGALSDEDTKIRSYAAELAGSWKAEEILPILVKMLKEDRANEVRASCAYALGAYGEASTAPALISALGDDYTNVRAYALESLKKISGKNYNYDQDAWSDWFNNNK